MRSGVANRSYAGMDEEDEEASASQTGCSNGSSSARRRKRLDDDEPFEGKFIVVHCYFHFYLSNVTKCFTTFPVRLFSILLLLTYFSEVVMNFGKPEFRYVFSLVDLVLRN